MFVNTRWPAKIQGPKNKKEKERDIHHEEGGSPKNQSREMGLEDGGEEV
jgi:hypothetical protein